MSHHKGRHILEHARSAANHSVSSDAHELMRCGLSAENGVVADNDMTAQSHIIGQNHVAADLTVVRHMGIGHKEIAAADSR